LGTKSWHFRYTWLGRQKRMSLGMYPEIGLREARTRRDAARALVAKDINPQRQRSKDRSLAAQAEGNTFKAVYEQWLKFREQGRLKQGHQTTLSLIPRIFGNDVLPSLGKKSIHVITRRDLSEIVGRIEKRGAPSVAEKVRTWLNQLFRYALVIVPGLERNPASDLDVVAMPQPPVRHNPFLRMPELPEFLQLLRRCRTTLRRRRPGPAEVAPDTARARSRTRKTMRTGMPERTRIGAERARWSTGASGTRAVDRSAAIDSADERAG
jgi:hypothetical protein